MKLFQKNGRTHFGCSKITQEHSWMLPDASRVHFGVSRDFSFSTIFRPKSGEHGNFKAKCSSSKIRISTISLDESASFCLTNLILAMRKAIRIVSLVKNYKNRVFCIYSGPPLGFQISTPRRGASHHFEFQ